MSKISEVQVIEVQLKLTVNPEALQQARADLGSLAGLVTGMPVELPPGSPATPWIDLREWTRELDVRQWKEIYFARVYEGEQFKHGTDGHHRLLLIAKLSRLCEELAAQATHYKRLAENEPELDPRLSEAEQQG